MWIIKHDEDIILTAPQNNKDPPFEMPDTHVRPRYLFWRFFILKKL